MENHMILERFQVPGLAQYSFVVGDSGCIAVIDPKRDVDTYTEYAKSRGVQIAYVLETCIDPVSASVARALASQAGATLCLNRYASSEADPTGVTHRALFEGDEVLLGKLVLKVAHNSRLPEQINLLLIDPFKNETPIASFSEGSLLVGSIVKPDLPGGGGNERLAKALCQGIQRIQDLQRAWGV
jgi:hydroxyacylglutathione hydrolase